MYFFVFSITYHSLLEFFRNSIYILRITRFFLASFIANLNNY